MNFREASKEISKELLEYRKRIRESFVAGAYQIHAGIVKKFYTASPGSSEGLARRTGSAAKSWKVDVSKSQETISCSIYSAGAQHAGAFMSGKFIRPKKKQWLAIPVGPSLTKSGAARYPGGPREAAKTLVMPPLRRGGFGRRKSGERDPLSFYQKDSNTAFLFAKPGVKGTGLTKKNRLMFVLKKVVKRQAKTAGLMPWVDKRVSTLVDRLSAASKSNMTIGE